MTQTYRTDDMARWGTGQGFNLSAAQVDINFWDLVQRMIAQEARPDAAAGIDHFEIVGINMFVHMTDATVLGPYELPVATFNDRGVWTPSTVYSKMDTFSINGGLYVVTWDHTSALTFDAGANDGAGHDYYQLMIQTPGSAMPAGGAVGALLKKTTTTDYAVGWGYTSADVVTFDPADGSTLTSDNVAEALEELAAAGGGGDAVDVAYDPTASGLTATNVQDAIDELAAAAPPDVVGRQTVWIPAVAMTPRITNGAAVGTIETATNKNMIRTLDFDTTTIEYAQFDIAMPKSWNLGNLAFKAFWSHASTTTNFGVSFALVAVAVSNADALDVAFGSSAAVTDTGGTANTQYVSDESGAMTVAGTPAFGDLIMFRINRVPSDSGDTLAVDARLHGVQVYYTTNTATDD
jgi:hypothetical protein